jgi:hypothetical protein
MTGHPQIVALVVSAALLVLVIELVRRRRLAERYALIWLACVVAGVLTSLWTELVLLAIGFLILVLLQYSVELSRLGDQTKVLAQRLALLEERLRASGVEPGDADEQREEGVARHDGDDEPGDHGLQPASRTARR